MAKDWTDILLLLILAPLAAWLLIAAVSRRMAADEERRAHRKYGGRCPQPSLRLQFGANTEYKIREGKNEQCKIR